MLSENILAQERISSRLKKRENLDFVITTTFVAFLLIVGIFMSHNNKHKFQDEDDY